MPWTLAAVVAGGWLVAALLIAHVVGRGIHLADLRHPLRLIRGGR